ncbi:MAG TPA: TFIIB-type zinc ribbon-containing protein [Nitrososphaerales archaeon]|nr:transcription initiation factor IIB [Nitrososphaerota archaeon]HUK75913.1 TFIIB-type zinc ribbon-containing protein [Nitrososphaerales archaeon]HVB95798.1 TFIIB-type zinc ribbon-containing protein [Nitrososphaerales archaeon]HVC27551.1 TFIIB-type zinc ribbon-containing protein [Nitrososphaerales archaeon]HYW83038.1 TFIIB-type zinc ribbon-containing protein [Spirochaetia bacterium]
MSSAYARDPGRQRRFESATDRCPRCGKTTMVTDNPRGEVYCTSCGFVVKENVIETGPEWRSFSNEEKDERSRTGLPTSVAIHDMGLATIIGGENKDAAGRSLTGAMKSSVERMRTWDRRSQVHESQDRNLKQAFSELRRLSEKLSVSEAVTERAAYIYRKALERNLVRGRSITAILAASLYAACRDREVPRTLKDVAAVGFIKKKDLARSYRLLLKEMDIQMPVVDPMKCMSKIASRANVSGKTQRRAREILLRAEQARISAGKDPMGISASALYVACILEGENMTQRDIADAAGVTEVTIRNRYKGLRLALGI